jgi:hypothetical protein
MSSKILPTNTVIQSVEQLIADKSIVWYIPEIDISPPETFDGREVWKGCLTPSMNQGNCGSCWAFSAASCLSDKFNIQSMGQLNIQLSPTRILLCSFTSDENLKNYIARPNDEQITLGNIDVITKIGCFGATLYTAWDYLYIWGTNTIQCAPYKNLGNFQNPADMPLCAGFFGLNSDMCSDFKYWEKNNMESGTPARFYRCENYYYMPGIAKLGGSIDLIKYGIYRYGPVAASFTVYPNFYTFDPKKEIYAWDGQGKPISGHSIEIVGWGKDHWIIKNFWGPEWGINGYFYMKFGECGIENYIVSGAPDFFYPSGYDPTVGIGQGNIRASQGNASKNKRFAVESRLAILNGGIDPETGYSRRILRNRPWLDASRVINIETLPDFNTWVAGRDATPEGRKKYMARIESLTSKKENIFFIYSGYFLAIFIFFTIISLFLLKLKKRGK